jgi:hypothetical protein
LRSLSPPKIASTSSSNKVGRSASILRNIADSEAPITRHGERTSSSKTSAKRVLPARRAGDWTTRYGVQCAPSSAWVCATQSAIASAAASEGSTT